MFEQKPSNDWGTGNLRNKSIRQSVIIVLGCSRTIFENNVMPEIADKKRFSNQGAYWRDVDFLSSLFKIQRRVWSSLIFPLKFEMYFKFY